VDLAMRTGAVLIPGWIRRIAKFKVEAIIGPPLPLVLTGNADHDLRVNTQRVLKIFEEHLKEDPGQWSVLDRIWPDDLPASRALDEVSEEPVR